MSNNPQPPFAATGELVLDDGDHSESVEKKLKSAIRQIENEGTNTGEQTLSNEEIVKLIQSWEPQRDIVCLYVRWGRQLNRNFNLESIATLYCISRQCGYTPLDFIRKVKTLSIQRHEKGIFGVPHRNDLNHEKLNKEFVGLSYTLSRLEQEIAQSQCFPSNIQMPNQHTMMKRIWTAVSHRWIAFFTVEHLFREENDNPWDLKSIMTYSIQMMIQCGPSRFDFLSPLVGYCLRYTTKESIHSNRAQLQTVRDDVTKFFSYGNTCLRQFSEETKSEIVIKCLSSLQEEIANTKKKIAYNRYTSWDRRWTMLRAYILQFWLEARSNSSLKKWVQESCNNITDQATRKSIINNNKRKKGFSTTNTGEDIVSVSPSAESMQQHVNGVGEDTAVVPPLQKKALFDTRNGIKSIVTSRSRKSPPSQNNDAIRTARDNTNNMRLLPSLDDALFCRLRLISSQELLKFVQSYLLIHRTNGHDLLSELSPLEVYSADRLHELIHSRMSGPSPFFPDRNTTSPYLFSVRMDAQSYFDDSPTHTLYLAREDSSYFLDHDHYLPNLEKIQRLCKAIFKHGIIDKKRAPGQYRVNMGNGGQNWDVDTRAPCKLHGLKFQYSMEKHLSKEDIQEVLETIGQLSVFTWRVMCSLQEKASAGHPIAPDAYRRDMYASHLNKYLGIDATENVGYEDLTLVLSSLHPTVHEVLEHTDNMNDTIPGYTQSTAFNMVLIDDIMINDNTAGPTILHFQLICNFRKVIGQYMARFVKDNLGTAASDSHETDLSMDKEDKSDSPDDSIMDPSSEEEESYGREASSETGSNLDEGTLDDDTSPQEATNIMEEEDDKEEDTFVPLPEWAYLSP